MQQYVEVLDGTTIPGRLVDMSNSRPIPSVPLFQKSFVSETEFGMFACELSMRTDKVTGTQLSRLRRLSLDHESSHPTTISVSRLEDFQEPGRVHLRALHFKVAGRHPSRHGRFDAMTLVASRVPMGANPD